MSSTLSKCILFIIMLISPYYSKYYNEQNLTFIYYGNEYNLINIANLQIQLSHDKLHIHVCNEDKQSFPIKQNISYHLNFMWNENMVQFKLNQHILYQQKCQIGTNYFQNKNLAEMWTIKNEINSHHFRHLLATNSTNSSIQPTENKQQSEFTYKWYEIWKPEWWKFDDWSTPKFITVIAILFAVLILIIIVTTCCICLACKKCKKNHINYKTISHKDSNPYPSASLANNYKGISADTDIDTDNDTAVTGLSNDMANSEEPFQKQQRFTVTVVNPQPSRSRQYSRSRGTSAAQVSEEIIELKENKDMESDNNDVMNSSDSASQLFEQVNDTATAGQGQENDTAYQDTPYDTIETNTSETNTSTLTGMDKASIKGCLKAAEMTAGSLKSFSGQVEIKDNSFDMNMSNELIEPKDDEGFLFDNWLKNTLSQLFPEDWKDILSHFKQQKITEDVLISMNTDKQNKSEIWKELIPIIGDRIRFQKAWNDELMRRQLSKRT